jgi:AcrR family transcriptional regulator
LAQKVEVPEDLRVQRTRKLLQRALFELAVEKGFAAVTVRDIAKRAMVNRSTFYRHYLDKYELLNQYLDELQALVSEAALLAENASQRASESVPAGLLVLVKHVQEYADFYRAMLGQNGDQIFTHRFRQMSEKRYRYLFSRFGDTPDLSAPPLDLKLNYISCAAVGAILWWLEHDQPSTAEQLAIWLGQLSMTTAGLTLPPLTPSSP